MEQQQTIFADGVLYEPKEIENMPWLKAALSFRVKDFKEFLDTHVNDRGYVNCDVKVGKSGKWYVSLNKFNAKPRITKPEVTSEDAPF